MDLTPTRRVLIAFAVTASVAACTAQPTTHTTPEPSPTPSPTPAAIAGSWVSHLTRDDITRQIDKAGLSRWTTRFLTREAIRADNTAVYTFADGRFQVAYFEDGGIWHVGWAGPYAVTGNQIQMTDEFTGTTDTYHWRVSKDQLDLDRVSSDAEEVNGIPFAVYDAAYLSNWWVRTDCVMETGKRC